MKEILLTSEEITIMLNALDNRVVRILNSELSSLNKNELNFIKRMEERLLDFDINASCVNVRFTSLEIYHCIHSLSCLFRLYDLYPDEDENLNHDIENLLDKFCKLDGEE